LQILLVYDCFFLTENYRTLSQCSTGKLHAIFFTTPVKQPGSSGLFSADNDWEVPAVTANQMCLNWCDDACAYKTSWSTMHIFLQRYLACVVYILMLAVSLLISFVFCCVYFSQQLGQFGVPWWLGHCWAILPTRRYQLQCVGGCQVSPQCSLGSWECWLCYNYRYASFKRDC
jgi:hypothetical protein